VVLTNACLGFGGTIPIFTGGGAKNVNFGQRFFDKVRNWGLTIQQLGKYGKSNP